MTTDEFLENILSTYKSTFDIYRPYNIDGTDILAYGYFTSHNEKYVLTKVAKLWESNSYEHIFFLEKSKLEVSDIASVDKLIKNKIEPELILKGEKLPAKNHMYSYVTVVFLTNDGWNKEAKKQLTSYKYNHSYLFSIRGWCEVRMIGVDLHNKLVISNRPAKPLINHYKNILLSI